MQRYLLLRYLPLLIILGIHSEAGRRCLRQSTLRDFQEINYSKKRTTETRQRGLGGFPMSDCRTEKPARCGGSPRCSDWRNAERRNRESFCVSFGTFFYLEVPYAFHTTCDTPRSQGVSADIWALISPDLMRHPKRPAWWENNNEK